MIPRDDPITAKVYGDGADSFELIFEQNNVLRAFSCLRKTDGTPVEFDFPRFYKWVLLHDTIMTHTYNPVVHNDDLDIDSLAWQ